MILEVFVLPLTCVHVCGRMTDFTLVKKTYSGLSHKSESELNLCDSDSDELSCVYESLTLKGIYFIRENNCINMSLALIFFQGDG